MSLLKRIFPSPSLPAVSLTAPAEKDALRQRHDEVIRRLDNLKAELAVIRRNTTPQRKRNA